MQFVKIPNDKVWQVNASHYTQVGEIFLGFEKVLNFLKFCANLVL